MKITRITTRKVEIPLVQPIVLAIGTIASYDAVYVKIETDEGFIGYGESAGAPFVTGETNDTVLNAIKMFETVLHGENPYAIASIHSQMDKMIAHNSSAKAAIDIALYDIMAKGANLPLFRFLGGVSNVVETDMTISLNKPQTMAEEAKEHIRNGFRELKVKAGADDAQDIEAIRLIRQAAPEARIKVDANQGWSTHQAMRMLPVYAEARVTALEQPVPYWDLDGLKYLRDRSPIVIMADESCFSLQDAAKIAKLGAADMINIKLMKSGGLYRALQIDTVAEAAGIHCMLGCMLESRLSIAAGAALVAARPNFIFADLDSFLIFGDTPMLRKSFRFETPRIVLSEKPGIGEELDI